MANNVIIGVINTHITGVNHIKDEDIKNKVTNGDIAADSDIILFKRSMNPDPNGISALTGDGNEIGYLGKNYAQVLAPLMDNGKITIYGAAGTNRNGFQVAVEITVRTNLKFGTKRAALTASLDKNIKKFSPAQDPDDGSDGN